MDYPLTVFRKHIHQEVKCRKLSSLPNVKPCLKRRRIKEKRNEIAALWILKIGWQLEDACCGPSQHCSMMQHKLRKLVSEKNNFRSKK
jgi:hypothetical protein